MAKCVPLSFPVSTSLVPWREKRGLLLLDLFRVYLNEIGEDFMSGLRSQASHWSPLMLWRSGLLPSQWVLGHRFLLGLWCHPSRKIEHLMIVWGKWKSSSLPGPLHGWGRMALFVCRFSGLNRPSSKIPALIGCPFYVWSTGWWKQGCFLFVTIGISNSEIYGEEKEQGTHHHVIIWVLGSLAGRPYLRIEKTRESISTPSYSIFL